MHHAFILAETLQCSTNSEICDVYIQTEYTAIALNGIEYENYERGTRNIEHTRDYDYTGSGPYNA